MVDWSGGGDRGPRPTKDAIWIAEARKGADFAPIYMRNRVVAEAHLVAMIESALSADARLLIGFDFPFGYPAGFARAVTGSDDPFALWKVLAAALPPSPAARERVEVAAALNAHCDGAGPFWFNPFSADVPGLPRKKPAAFPVPEWRAAEAEAKGAFSCWQLGGAGSVGSQALTGIATLERLRTRFAGKVQVWPFEPLDAPIALVEIWPSLIAATVAEGQKPEEIKDAAQVRILASAIRALTPEELETILTVDHPLAKEEGWIFGLGHEETLVRAAR
ncbi:MAG: molybdopterin guanine dinucleotide synthesis [Pseudomonadota bacterium]